MTVLADVSALEGLHWNKLFEISMFVTVSFYTLTYISYVPKTRQVPILLLLLFIFTTTHCPTISQFLHSFRTF